ncbi:MAG: TonB-dependent receptor [Pseudomonadota bacterium]|uniref:Outer membrane receptor proteins, mostly Fe transport n=1 Tax=hydrothermal vent metagenome TaxID=652676 RepID=A0A160TLZ9_9ZZZZ
MKVSHRLGILAASTILANAAVPAFAQSASPTPGDQTTPVADDAMADIIVTANKREERLHDVPISISVIGGDQITKQNINEVTDLVRSTPALNSAGPFGALSIRGVGSISFARSAEGSVGVVVDGVALANTSTNPPQLFDIARVEVLEGPQGTLFGRNSSAGVVNITTVAPDPNKWEVIGHADIATRNNYIGRAVINVPVSGNAALRVAGSYSQAPETQYNRYDGSYFRNTGKSVRGRFKWDPIDALTINLGADYSQFDRKGGTPWTVYQSTPGSLLSQRLAACGVVVGPENQQGCIDGGNATTTRSYGFSGQVDAQIGGLTLTSISAYRAFKSTFGGTDVDSVPINRLNVNESPTSVRNFSQEFRLTSPTGGLIDYVVGLYYFDSKLDGTNTQRGNILSDFTSGPAAALCPLAPFGPPAILCALPVGQVQTTSATTTSYAAFGNATLNISPSFRLLFGARYGREDVDARTTGVLVPGALTGVLSIAPISAGIHDTYFSYRVGAQFDVTRNVMLYGTYTRGYKGPSINDQTGTGNIPKIVQPEIPHAGEIGVKANVFNGRLTASIAGFYNRIDNFQAQFFDPTAGAFIFGNAPKLTTKGVSFNLTGRPTRGLTLNLGALYNDARYGAGYLVACAQGQTAAQGCMTIAPGVTVDDAGGNRLTGAPEWKVTAFSEYAATLTGNIQGFVQADMAYTSRINFDAAYSPQNTNAPAAIFGGRIGVRTVDERFGISVFARNLFDIYRPVVRFATPVARQQLDPLSFSQISGPESRRTIGVSLDAKF